MNHYSFSWTSNDPLFPSSEPSEFYKFDKEGFSISTTQHCFHPIMGLLTLHLKYQEQY